MNLWYTAIVTSGVLVLVNIEALVKSIREKKEKLNDILTLVSALLVLILALLTIRFSWFRADLKVDYSISYSFAGAGFILLLESGIRTVLYVFFGKTRDASRIANRGIIGGVVFLGGLVGLLVTHG
jgi:hypothetical protein